MVDYKETELSKRKHADFMFNLAEKIFALVFGILFGASSKTWITGEKLSDLEFNLSLFVLGIGGGLGIYLMRSALKCYAGLGQVNSQNGSISATATDAHSPPESPDAEKPICIAIEHGATKISIRIE